MRDNLLGILIIVGILLGGVYTWMAGRQDHAGPGSTALFEDLGIMDEVRAGPAIGLVPVKDVIWDTHALVEVLVDWEKDDDIKAILVVIDSPGGAVGPSQSLYDALMQIRAAGKPVVATMGTVAASGGYYVASAADSIWAQRGTLTGSIGVIMQMMDFSELAAEIGVHDNTIKTGPYKDTGNPFRPMSVTEQSYLQSVVDQTYEQFIKDILAGRPSMDESKLRALANGKVYTGEYAAQQGLVDAVGGYRDALRATAELAGLDVNDPPVRRPRLRHRLEELFGQFGIEGRFAGMGFASGKEARRMAYNPVWLMMPGVQP